MNEQNPQVNDASSIKNPLYRQQGQSYGQRVMQQYTEQVSAEFAAVRQDAAGAAARQSAQQGSGAAEEAGRPSFSAVQSPLSSAAPQQCTAFDRGVQAPVGHAPVARSAYDDVASSADGEGRGRRGVPGPLCVALVVLALVVGALGTFAVMKFAVGPGFPVSATLGADDLDTVVGTYRYDGTLYQVTAREALESTDDLEAALRPDGTYDAPSADAVVAVARNAVLKRIVEDYGVSVDQDEVDTYLQGAFGTSDVAAVASSLGLGEQAARAAAEEAAAVAKLRAQVVGVDASEPQAPWYPADGNTEVGTAEYADYVIGLLGEHWNASLQMWADTDNDYYRALEGKVFAAGSANYEAAQAAYTVACDEYAAAGDEAGQAWLDLVNSYLDKACITVATLRA